MANGACQADAAPQRPDCGVTARQKSVSSAVSLTLGPEQNADDGELTFDGFDECRRFGKLTATSNAITPAMIYDLLLFRGTGDATTP